MRAWVGVFCRELAPGYADVAPLAASWRSRPSQARSGPSEQGFAAGSTYDATIAAMAVSGTCAATIGFSAAIRGAGRTALSGISIADSAQFSASIAELADPARVGTMLTVQTALGFTLTLVTIHLMPYLVDALGWRYAFVPLRSACARFGRRAAPIRARQCSRVAGADARLPQAPASRRPAGGTGRTGRSCRSRPRKEMVSALHSRHPTEANMGYHLEGRLLEVCNCRVLCPCWIGEDPDFGTCDTIVAWHFDKGTIDGVDVSDRTIAMIAHVPGNILQGNWKAAVYLDERVTPAQEAALLAVYTGQKGGPIAELAKLVGEVVSVEKVPVTFTVQGGHGTIATATPATPS
jgi:hypothetical protein